MRNLFLIVLLSAASAAAQAPVRIILVGDSTVAPNNGWGPGFCSDVTAQVTCVNRAKNGRSPNSYRAEGLWTQVMDELKHNSAFSATYVFIQFGHNDQPGKPRPADPAIEFPRNLRQYVQELKAAGAKPVLITSLTRRSFKNGKLQDDLEPWAAATRRAAAEESVPVLDLHTDSMAAVQKMGPLEATTLAMEPPAQAIAKAAATGTTLAVPSGSTFDYTHLGEKGSAVFGRMVADELKNAVPELRPYIKP
jgi:lysophospholipase L1-like esterase